MRLMKFLLVWVIVLAIPAQGMAASAMLLCGPGHQRMQAGAERGAHHELAQAAQGTEDGAGAVHHHHGSVAPEPQADPASAGAPAGSHAHQGDELGKHTCSACASCCSAAAMLQAFPDVAEVAAVAEPAVQLLGSVSAFITGGPDRPPRPREA